MSNINDIYEAIDAEGREGQCQPRAEVSSPKSYAWSCSFN